MKKSKIVVSFLTLAVAFIVAMTATVTVQAASWKKSFEKQNKIKIQKGMDQTNTFVEFTLKSKAEVTIISKDSAGNHYGGFIFRGTSAQLKKDFLAKKYNEDAWYDNVLSADNTETINDNTCSQTFTLDKGTYTFYMSTINKSSTHKVKISTNKKVLKYNKLRTLQINSGMF